MGVLIEIFPESLIETAVNGMYIFIWGFPKLPDRSQIKIILGNLSFFGVFNGLT